MVLCVIVSVIKKSKIIVILIWKFNSSLSALAIYVNNSHVRKRRTVKEQWCAACDLPMHWLIMQMHWLIMQMRRVIMQTDIRDNCRLNGIPDFMFIVKGTYWDFFSEYWDDSLLSIVIIQSVIWWKWQYSICALK